MISPDITISNHRLRWAVDGMRFTAPCKNMVEVLHLFRWFTHTPSRRRWKIKVRTVKWKWNWREMKMRWRWKWDESYLTRTRRGERNAEGKRKHQHKEPGPPRANPEKARKKKSGGRRKRKRTSGGGGRTDAPEPTYHSETYAYLSTRRTQPTWREENAGTHEIRDPWGTS